MMLWPFDEVNSNIDERVVESVSVSEEAVAPLSQRRMVRLWTPWGSGPQPEEEAVAPLSQRRMVRLWTPWGTGKCHQQVFLQRHRYLYMDSRPAIPTQVNEKARIIRRSELEQTFSRRTSQSF
jgi:hypothetical protein